MKLVLPPNHRHEFAFVGKTGSAVEITGNAKVVHSALETKGNVYTQDGDDLVHEQHGCVIVETQGVGYAQLTATLGATKFVCDIYIVKDAQPHQIED